MTDLRNIKIYLGIYIFFNDGIMRLSQSRYIEKLANDLGVTDANIKFTPMEKNLRLESSKRYVSPWYCSLIDSLLYIATCTRPNVSYPVNYLSCFYHIPLL